MPARSLPNLGLQAFFTLGEDGWNDEMDRNLLLLSVLVQGGVISTVSATPATPTDGDVYLFAADHPTEPNQIAIRDAGAWLYVVPVEGWRVYDRTAGTLLLFDGVAWGAFSGASANVPYAVPFGFTDAPVGGETMLITVFAENVTFPDNWAGAQATIGTNPTSTAVFSIHKNGTEVGTISVSTTGTVTFATSGAEVAFAAGDVLTVVAPATADATLANSAFTIKGTRG